MVGEGRPRSCAARKLDETATDARCWVSGSRRIPLPLAYCQQGAPAEEGGLIAHGLSLLGAFRQVTTLVVKVLQGAKAGDLPVEQPTRSSLIINLKTARALGLNIPPLTLTRADRVIG
jgi:putative ABC transport system substrate-binding protein